MDWDKRAEERVEAARVKLITTTISKFKTQGINYCRHFAKEYMEATDADIEKSLKIVFGTDYSEDTQ